MQTSQFIRVFVLLAAWQMLSLMPVWADEATTDEESKLLAVLRSEAPASDKAITCKRLAIQGTSAAVPDLAKLLPDPQLSSWARIALEAIPGPEADQALREASGSLQGRLLIGMINSLGVRQDAQAVEGLTAHLQAKDSAVASAAAVALGRIGGEDATGTLRKALTTAPEQVRSAVAEGCVLCAERLWADGNPSEAVALYDEVRGADVPQQRVIEATRGAILARGPQGIPLLLEQFRSSDTKMFQLALGTAREFPGGEVDKALAAEINQAAPERAALIIVAMADRPQTVVLPALLGAAATGEKPVRLAAIEALGRVGDVSCLPPLLEIAIEGDTQFAQTARTALAQLQDEQVDRQILALLPRAAGDRYPVLIEVIGQRRIPATDALVEALAHADPAVRHAALTALGETVLPSELSILIGQAVTPQHAEDAAIARKSLMAASVRMPDREACATELTAAIEGTSSVPTKSALLEILGAVAGTKALATIRNTANGSDAELQDISSRLLGEWMTADAAPVLLELAKAGPEQKYQVRALRGYIRIARQFVLPQQERAAMCQQALEAANQTAERKLVLDVLKRYPSTEMLKLAIAARDLTDVNSEATEATLFIAQKLGSKGNAPQILAAAGLKPVKLEIIKAEYGDGTTQKDVTEILRKQIGDLPLITLRAAKYNLSFGGDPVPGKVKRLTIQYRINGQPGEASFAEDALIVLPLPE